MGKDGFFKSINDVELPEGSMRAVRVRGNPILLVKVNGQVFGVYNRCPHMGCELQGGILTGYILMCGCHGWKFDVRNGQYLENPLTALKCYSCRIENGKIMVEIEK